MESRIKAERVVRSFLTVRSISFSNSSSIVICIVVTVGYTPLAIPLHILLHTVYIPYFQEEYDGRGQCELGKKHHAVDSYRRDHAVDLGYDRLLADVETVAAEPARVAETQGTTTSWLSSLGHSSCHQSCRNSV